MGKIFDSWNEGIDVDITLSMARIVVNEINLPFTSVRTSIWVNGPANDLIVTTKKRVNEFYRFFKEPDGVRVLSEVMMYSRLGN